MSVSDVLALVSTSEPFGAVVAEGLQWGTPCVVSDNCGASVLIEDGTNGAVFKYGDESGFVDACKRVPNRSGESLLPVELKDFISALVGNCR
jgi:glycosyltransferase involved in cell wall biosynthesis